MSKANGARGLIAVDKMGGKVLFLNPATYATEVVLDGVPIGQSGAELLEGVDHASRSLKTVLRYRNGNEQASKCEAGARPCRRFA